MSDTKEIPQDPQVKGELGGLRAVRKEFKIENEDKDVEDTEKKDDDIEEAELQKLDKEDDFTLKLREIAEKKKADDEEEKPKGKEDHVAELRKRYDALKVKMKAMEESGGELLSPVNDLIADSTGELITEDSVSAFIVDVKNKDSRIKELEEQLSAGQSKLRDLNIKQTDEWKTGYEAPYMQAQESLLADLVNVDPVTGDVKHREFVADFRDGLASAIAEEGEVDQVKVKTTIKKFAAEFKKRTGEDYQEPSIRDVAISLQSILHTRAKAEAAYADWESDKQGREAEVSLLSKREQEEKSVEIKRARFNSANEALNGFDFETSDGVFERDQITRAFQETFKKSESYLKDPSEAPSYGEVMATQAKGALYDELMTKYKELQSELVEQRSSTKQGVYGSSMVGDQILYKPKEGSKGLGELRKRLG